MFLDDTISSAFNPEMVWIVFVVIYFFCVHKLLCLFSLTLPSVLKTKTDVTVDNPVAGAGIEIVSNPSCQ